MPKEKLTKFIGNFRVSEKTFNELERLAELDARTTHGYIRVVLDKHVKDKEKPDGK